MLVGDIDIGNALPSKRVFGEQTLLEELENQLKGLIIHQFP